MEKNINDLSNILMELGFPEDVSKTLAYLKYHDSSYGIDIETGTGLREPYVSNAIKYLKEKRWVKCKRNRKLKKGRPPCVYSLSKPFKEIIEEIVKKKKENLGKFNELIEKLKNFY